MLFLEYILLPLIRFIATNPLAVADTQSVRYRSRPWMTLLLIVVNIVVFLVWQGYLALLTANNEPQLLSAITHLTENSWQYGIRAPYLYEGYSVGALTSITSMFMHADIMHLFSNMLGLWAFGRRLEDACGAWRFLLYFLLAGMVSGIGTVIIVPPDSQFGWDTPGIGASGAVFGLMGAYLLLFPASSISCLWGVGIFFRGIYVLLNRLTRGGISDKSSRALWRWTTDIPAIFVVLLFVWDDFLDAFAIIGEGAELQGVNVIAHLTGFLSAITIFFFVRKDLLNRYLKRRNL